MAPRKKDAETTASKPTVISRPYKTTILVTFAGTKPLLCNPSTDTLVANLIAGHNPGKDTRPVDQQAKDKLIVTTDGDYMVPRSWVFACLREAGRKVSYKTAKDKITSGTQGTMLPSFLDILHRGYVIHDGEGNPLKTFEVDCRKGNNSNAGKGKGVAVGIVRPRFDPPWAIDVEMIVRTDRIDLDRILQLFEVAGEQKGLGDGRPGCGVLDFGMFEVSQMKVTGTQKPPKKLEIQGLELMTQIEAPEDSSAAA